MKEFANIPMFIAFTSSLVVETDRRNQRNLHRAAKVVVKEAKRVIGTYDYGWRPLSEKTLAKKEDDTPLLETGAMRDSIWYTVQNNEFQVGSDDQKAVWQELGTKKIPPRSFLAGAMHRKAARVAHILGGDLVNHLASHDIVKDLGEEND
jgi:phage gpG-like protein